MHDDIKQVLLTKEQIEQRVAEMGKQITADYQGKDLIVVVLLKGAAWFVQLICPCVWILWLLPPMVMVLALLVMLR